MTFRQRYCVFTFAFNTMMTVIIFPCYCIIPALLYWGRDLMVYTTLEQLRWQLRLGTVWVVLMRLNEIIVSLPSGYIQSQRCSMAYQFMIPYIAVSVLRCYILPWWLGGKEIAFLASGAIRDRLKERNKDLRAGLGVRLRLMGWNCRIYFHLLFCLFCLGAAGIDWWRAAKLHRATGDIVPALRHLLVNSMLPPMWWLMLFLAYLIPVVYVFFPMTVADRDDLMDFDPKTGAGYPKTKQINQTWGVVPLIREIFWALTLIYCVVIFIGTFIY